jgi:hypothetical protein
MDSYSIANEIIRLVKTGAIRLRFERRGWAGLYYGTTYKDREIEVCLRGMSGELIIKQDKFPSRLLEFQLKRKQVKELKNLVKSAIEEAYQEKAEAEKRTQAKKEEILEEMFPLLKP